MPRAPRKALLAGVQPACAQCAHFNPEQADPGEAQWGSCLRYPPQVVMHSDDEAGHRWPAVYPTDRCGEFKPKQ